MSLQKMEFHHSFPFVDGQYHKLRGASVTALTPDQAIGSAQSMLRLLSSLLSLTVRRYICVFNVVDSPYLPD